MPASALKDAKANGKLDIFRASWVADYPDAENYLSLSTAATLLQMALITPTFQMNCLMNCTSSHLVKSMWKNVIYCTQKWIVL